MQTAQAQVQTGFVFPSAGVRILIPLVVSAFMEEASGQSMNALSDYNIGVSVGSVPASAFSFSDPIDSENPKFTAREVLYSTFAVAHMMFARDPKQVFTNNVWRDATVMARQFLARGIGKYISGSLELRRPSIESARYDPRILEESILKRFGQNSVSEARKTFFIIAHGLKGGMPHFFGHIDEARYPRSTDIPLHIDNIPLHGDVAVSEAIMSATAIPGMIGYRHIDALAEHFMDSGAFSAPSFGAIMEDMHDLATLKALRDHGQRLSARNMWQKVAGMVHADAPPTPVVSRLVQFGIGDESQLAFDTSNDGGVVNKANDIVRAAGNHVNGFSLAHIKKRFDKASRAQTGLPGLQIIDCNIIPQNDEERATFPSADIVDGRIQNLMRLMAFGRKVAIENRDIIFDEINLRMETLEARGVRTPEQVAAVAQRLDKYRPEAEATALCDRIVFGQDQVQNMLEKEARPATGIAEIAAATQPRAAWRRASVRL